MLNTHEANHGSSCCNPLPRSTPARGGAIAIGVLVLGGLSACAEPQQSVKRYQPDPVQRRAATPEVTETPVQEDYRERAEAIERVCKRKASTDLGRCWSDEAVTRRKRRPSLVQRQYFHDALVFLGLSVKARGGDGNELTHWQRLAAASAGNGGPFATTSGSVGGSDDEAERSGTGPKRRKKRTRLRRRDDDRPRSTSSR